MSYRHSSAFAFFVTLAFAWGLLALAPVSASQAPPTESEIQKALDSLSSSGLSEAETRQLRETYQGMLQQLRALRTIREQSEALARQLREAPRLTSSARDELQKLQAPDEPQLEARYARLPLGELERLLATRSEQLATWKEELARVNGELIAAQTSPERTQSEIAANQAREQALAAEIKQLQRQGDQPLSIQQQRLRRVEIQMLQQSSELLRQQLAGNAVLMDQGNARRDLLNRRIDYAEREQLALVKAVGERRRALSAQTLSDATEARVALEAGSVLQEQHGVNVGLSEELLRSTEALSRLTEQNLSARQQLDRLGQIEQALSEQIAVLKDSLLLSKILQQQKQSLPRIQLDGSLPDQVADIRLRQFELARERESLNHPDVLVASLLERSAASELSPEQRRELDRLIRVRVDLLERLNNELSAVLNLAISLQITQQQIKQASDGLQLMLDEQLFWIASNRPLSIDWLKAMPQQVLRQVLALPWVDAPLAVVRSLMERPLGGFLAVLLLGVYLARRRVLLARLARINEEVGQFRHDSPWHTPVALAISALITAPLSAIIALIGVWFSLDPHPGTEVLGGALIHLALALFVLRLLYRVLRKDSIADRHFRWRSEQVTLLRRLVHQMTAVVPVLAFVITLAEQDPASLPNDVLGVIVMLLGCAYISYVLWRAMRKSPPIYNSRVLHGLASLLLVATPLALMLMTGLGYYYTALKLAGRYLDSLYLLVAWIIASGTGERILRVAANRLGYQRARARQEAGPREGADGEPLPETSTLDMQQVNQQSMRLLTLTLVTIFSVLVYWVWSDLITVFSYLEGITLWQYTSGTGDLQTLVPISVRDVLGALVVIALTLILARNLPGLLEMLVLSRLDLRQGTAYAMTTLLSYVIVGVGLVSTLSALGVSWDKLQWLVAALSVGLGFGLQEIFANFVSGIILLFERPIRIGDVVTVGNLSGTVSRIRIRATTITDFDRKEIIVPNKTFITGHLVNWSLTDTVTRVTVKVGVAYGSDLELVRQLLQRAAAENPRVLREPVPQVYFLNFGESTLDHELRLHVRELGDRNPVLDEINRFIDREFKVHGIEIAFRQIDVHLRNGEGLETLVPGLRLGGNKPPAKEGKAEDGENA